MGLWKEWKEWNESMLEAMLALSGMSLSFDIMSDLSIVLFDGGVVFSVNWGGAVIARLPLSALGRVGVLRMSRAILLASSGSASGSGDRRSLDV